MEIYYKENAPALSVEWEVTRGKTSVREDFSHAEIWLFLTGENGMQPLSVEVEDNILKSEIPSGLEVGIYGLKVIWVKDGSGSETIDALLACNKRQMSEAFNVFGISGSQYADTSTASHVTFHIKSRAATYGYDGLSAYERAVMLGITSDTEYNWTKNVLDAAISQAIADVTADMDAARETLEEAIEVSANGTVVGAGECSTQQRGSGALATGARSAAFGDGSVASGTDSFAVGDSVEASGNNSHAEGHFTKARGSSSHAEGKNTEAQKAYDHAEGNLSVAKGGSSHAEGESTLSGGYCSHAEGQATEAQGFASHAGGFGCVASGDEAFVHGEELSAKNDNESAFGRCNVSNTGDTKAQCTIFSVGIGETNARKNGFEVRQDGSIYLWLNGNYVRLQDYLASLSNVAESSNNAAGTGYESAIEGTSYAMDYYGAIGTL